MRHTQNTCRPTEEHGVSKVHVPVLQERGVVGEGIHLW